MFDFITYTLLFIFLSGSLYLAGTSLKKESNSSSYKSISKKDLVKFEKEFNAKIDMILETVSSIDNSTKSLLDKKSEERLKKIETILSNFDDRLNEHCDSNDISFKDIITEYERVENELSEQLNKINISNMLMRLDQNKLNVKLTQERNKSEELLSTIISGAKFSA